MKRSVSRGSDVAERALQGDECDECDECDKYDKYDECDECDECEVHETGPSVGTGASQGRPLWSPFTDVWSAEYDECGMAGGEEADSIADS